MYAITKNHGKTTYNLVEIILDKEENIKTLPINFAPGSTAICSDTKNEYMLSTQDEWRLINR